ALGAGLPLPCPSDQASTPSYGPDVARAVVGLVEAGRSGLVHVAGPQCLGRGEFAPRLAHGFRLHPSLIPAPPPPPPPPRGPPAACTAACPPPGSAPGSPAHCGRSTSAYSTSGRAWRNLEGGQGRSCLLESGSPLSRLEPFAKTSGTILTMHQDSSSRILAAP